MQTTIGQIKQELRDIIELSDKATPGPWMTPCGHLVGEDTTIAHFVKDDDWEIEQRANKQLVKASRNLTPKMARALLGTLEILEHMTTYTTKAGTVASTALETICREWEVQP